MDVLWFKLPKLGADIDTGSGLLGSIGAGRILVVLDRFDHWQIGFVFPKGQYQQVKAIGIEAMRRIIVQLEPHFAEHVETLRDWQLLTLLSVESSRCLRWHQPGLLLIGDAVHVMSPVGGVGINNAIQDAVVAAKRNIWPRCNDSGSLRPSSCRDSRRWLRNTSWHRRSPRRRQPFTCPPYAAGLGGRRS